MVKFIKLLILVEIIYKFNGRTFCSDSFAKDGDAATQYNCEPFMNENRPKLEPNNSFDLCRLGCSLFDFVTDIDEDYAELDELQKQLYVGVWMTMVKMYYIKKWTRKISEFQII